MRGGDGKRGGVGVGVGWGGGLDSFPLLPDREKVMWGEMASWSPSLPYSKPEGWSGNNEAMQLPKDVLALR